MILEERGQIEQDYSSFCSLSVRFGIFSKDLFISFNYTQDIISVGNSNYVVHVHFSSAMKTAGDPYW